MTIKVFFQGVLIGLSIAAPVGPIGVLCIHRTLAKGRAAGFLSGLGAATADAIYGCIAGFGLTVISDILVRQQLAFRIVGGLFLGTLGIKTLLTQSAQPAAPVENTDRRLGRFSKGTGLLGAYTSTLFLTLTNPLTILAFAAILAGLSALGSPETSATIWVWVSGLFAGSVLWWFLLSTAASLLRDRIQDRGLQWINRVSGIVILGFSLVVLFKPPGT